MSAPKCNATLNRKGKDGKTRYCQNSIRPGTNACGIEAHIRKNSNKTKTTVKDTNLTKLSPLEAKTTGSIAHVQTPHDEPHRCPRWCGGLSIKFPYNELSYSVVKQLGELNDTGPACDDRQGHVYLYRLEGDMKDYYKLGKTTWLKRRMEQWVGSKQEHSRVCKRHGMAEKLLHIYFNSKRMYRCVMTMQGTKSEMVSFWYNNRQPVADDMFIKYRYTTMDNIRRKTVNNTVHEEWFNVELDQLKKVMNVIVNAINDLYEDEAWDQYYKGFAFVEGSDSSQNATKSRKSATRNASKQK
ncbi:MAG: GIY-YIG nuclease family protein [Promethearchaeota archaeon]